MIAHPHSDLSSEMGPLIPYERTTARESPECDVGHSLSPRPMDTGSERESLLSKLLPPAGQYKELPFNHREISTGNKMLIVLWVYWGVAKCLSVLLWQGSRSL